jgi:hypothetical protein
MFPGCRERQLVVDDGTGQPLVEQQADLSQDGPKVLQRLSCRVGRLCPVEVLTNELVFDWT